MPAQGKASSGGALRQTEDQLGPRSNGRPMAALLRFTGMAWMTACTSGTMIEGSPAPCSHLAHWCAF